MFTSLNKNLISICDWVIASHTRRIHSHIEEPPRKKQRIEKKQKISCMWWVVNFSFHSLLQNASGIVLRMEYFGKLSNGKRKKTENAIATAANNWQWKTGKGRMCWMEGAIVAHSTVWNVMQGIVVAISPIVQKGRQAKTLEKMRRMNKKKRK